MNETGDVMASMRRLLGYVVIGAHTFVHQSARFWGMR